MEYVTFIKYPKAQFFASVLMHTKASLYLSNSANIFDRGHTRLYVNAPPYIYPILF